MLRPLTNRNFRRLFTAQVSALTGTGLSTIALALLARDISGERATIILGTALALKMVAYVFIAPLASAALARLPRRALLATLDWARAGLVVVMPFVTTAWQVYVLIFLLNATSAAFTPIFQATVADTLPDEEEYTEALSLTRLAYDLENLLSPMIGAALLLLLSYHVLFATNGVLFVVSSLLVLASSVGRRSTSAHGASMLARAWRGFSAYLRTPRLQSLGGLSLSVAAAGAMVIVNTVSLVRDQLGLSDSAMATAMAAFGLGSLGVALTLPKLLSKIHEQSMMRVGIAASSLALLIGWAIELNYTTLLALWFVTGAGTSAVQTAAGRLLRRSAHPANQPELFATHFSLSHLCWLVTYPLAGYLYSVGPALAFAVMAGLSLLGLGISLFAWRRRDKGAIVHTHDATTHAHAEAHDALHGMSPDSVARESGRALGERRDLDSTPGPKPTRHQHPTFTHAHPIIIDVHHSVWQRSRT